MIASEKISFSICQCEEREKISSNNYLVRTKQYHISEQYLMNILFNGASKFRITIPIDPGLAVAALLAMTILQHYRNDCT